MKYLFQTEALGGYMLQVNPHKRHLKTEVQGEGEDRVQVKLNEIRESDLEYDSATQTLRIVDEVILVVTRPPKPVVVPVTITRRGLRKAMRRDGITFANVKAALSELTDEDIREDALIDLQDAQTIRRDHGLIAVVQAMFAKTDAEVDAYFLLAQELEPLL